MLAALVSALVALATAAASGVLVAELQAGEVLMGGAVQGGKAVTTVANADVHKAKGRRYAEFFLASVRKLMNRPPNEFEKQLAENLEYRVTRDSRLAAGRRRKRATAPLPLFDQQEKP